MPAKKAAAKKPAKSDNLPPWLKKKAPAKKAAPKGKK